MYVLIAAATPPDDPLWRVIIDVGTSVATSVGTLVAVAVAVWVAFVERDERRKADAARVKAEEERDALRIDERESQARRIVCWLEEEAGPAFTQSRTVVVVSNGSDLPAFGFRPRAYSPDTGQHFPAQYIAVLPPGETKRLALGHVVQGYEEDPYAILDFNDAAGQHWHRDELGRLEFVSGRRSPRSQIHP